MDSDDDDDDWEEQLVAVQLIGMIDPDKLNMIDEDNAAVLGVASDELTILKLGGYAFAGKYEDAVGSVVVLEDVKDENGESKLNFVGHTTKIIKANRIFLKAKEDSEEKSLAENVDEQQSTNQVTDKVPAVGDDTQAAETSEG